MFDPVKTILKLAIALMVLGFLGYTHLEAFKAGAAVRQHPLTNVLAEMMGLASPSCPPKPHEQDVPFWQG